MIDIAVPPNRLSSFRRRIVRSWLMLRYRLFDRRYGRLVLEQIDGVPLILLPEVFNPVLFRTGEFLVRALEGAPHPELRQDRVPLALDLGCGSGVSAVFAARRGMQVIASDLNPEAVRNTRLNALLNHFEDKIDVRLGDLFESVRDIRFELVLFNPPFYRGRTRSRLDMAWRAEGIFERFAAELKDHLTPSGRALIVLSTDGDTESLLEALRWQHYTITPTHRHDYGNEVITVYQITFGQG
jgi:methylase of polypeptide subunit release factors